LGARHTIAGILLFSSILASLGSVFFTFTAFPAGAMQLIAVVLLWDKVPTSVRRSCFFIIALSSLFYWWGNVSFAILISAFSKNHSIIAMLAAVGFLRIIAVPDINNCSATGRKAFWRTVFGVHWLGAVLNVSAIILLGDRMVSDGHRLGSTQCLLLTRGFALAALWSPFFVAMGVALTNAPGSNIWPLVLWGLPLSQLLLIILAWRMSSSVVGACSFSGYPITLESLCTPTVLILMVVIAHLFVPNTPIVSLITFIVPLYVFLACYQKVGSRAFVKYVCHDLPQMQSELALFIAAGILGTGINSIINRLSLQFIGSSHEVVIVWVGLAVIILFAAVGVHPVISIAAGGAVLAPSGISPNLLAMSFLMGWTLGVLINPISGIHLLISGRYGFLGRQVWRSNSLWVFCGYVVCCGWLTIFDYYS